MKLFDDMTPTEKLDHVERCMADALVHLQAEHGPVHLANIIDVWDYWAPYLIERCRRLEAVAEVAERLGCRITADGGHGLPVHALVLDLAKALFGLGAPAPHAGDGDAD